MQNSMCEWMLSPDVVCCCYTVASIGVCWTLLLHCVAYYKIPSAVAIEWARRLNPLLKCDVALSMDYMNSLSHFFRQYKSHENSIVSPSLRKKGKKKFPSNCIDDCRFSNKIYYYYHYVPSLVFSSSRRIYFFDICIEQFAYEWAL